MHSFTKYLSILIFVWFVFKYTEVENQLKSSWIRCGSIVIRINGYECIAVELKFYWDELLSSWIAIELNVLLNAIYVCQFLCNTDRNMWKSYEVCVTKFHEAKAYLMQWTCLLNTKWMWVLRCVIWNHIIIHQSKMYGKTHPYSVQVSSSRTMTKLFART